MTARPTPCTPLRSSARPAAGTPPRSRAPGPPDDAYEHDGQLTKRAIRAVTLAALAPGAGRSCSGTSGRAADRSRSSGCAASRTARAIAHRGARRPRRRGSRPTRVALGVPAARDRASAARRRRSPARRARRGLHRRRPHRAGPARRAAGSAAPGRQARRERRHARERVAAAGGRERVGGGSLRDSRSATPSRSARFSAWRAQLPIVQWSARKEPHDGALHRREARAQPDLLTLRAPAADRRLPGLPVRGRARARPRCSSTHPPARASSTLSTSTSTRSSPSCAAAHERGDDVARLHSGDLSIYSALAEQMRRLDELGIPWDVTPGVPAFAAAAAALRRELTLPRVAQTRDPDPLRRATRRRCRRARSCPALAPHGTTLVIHLGAQAIDEIVATLVPHYGPACPVAVVARASWPDELVLAARSRRSQRRCARRACGARRSIIVGPALAAVALRRSHLYSTTRARPAGGVSTSTVLILGGTGEARELAAVALARRRPGDLRRWRGRVGTPAAARGRGARRRLRRARRARSAGSRDHSHRGGRRRHASLRRAHLRIAPRPRARRAGSRCCGSSVPAGASARAIAGSGSTISPRAADAAIPSLGTPRASSPRAGRASRPSPLDGALVPRALRRPARGRRCPPGTRLLLDRGPYTVDGELALIDAHGSTSS